jgi:hypothetical protein
MIPGLRIETRASQVLFQSTETADASHDPGSQSRDPGQPGFVSEHRDGGCFA